MPANQNMTGRCLCGSVVFSVATTENGIGICHCEMCRRWSGGPVFAVHCESPVEFEGTEDIARFRSSDWAERGFCAKCGSNLFYRLVESDEYSLAAGAFDDQTRFVLENEIFVEEQPAYYAFANDTRRMTGAEAFAMFTAEDPDPE